MTLSLLTKPLGICLRAQRRDFHVRQHFIGQNYPIETSFIFPARFPLSCSEEQNRQSINVSVGESQVSTCIVRKVETVKRYRVGEKLA